MYVGTPRARSGLKEGGPRRQVRANREAPYAISLGSPSLGSPALGSPFHFLPLGTFVPSLLSPSSLPLFLSVSPVLRRLFLSFSLSFSLLSVHFIFVHHCQLIVC